ncbi:ATP-dependent DNA helicase pif1, partial [Choanephora cucurbitarum]
GRYIGPTEAFARLFEYKMHEEDPTVASLAFHLPNEQPVYFPEDANTPEIHPTCGERFYLRLLLVNIAGSKSFNDLKTVNGSQCSTFKQACLQLHLIEEGQGWIHYFEEASLFSSGDSFRSLFVTTLNFGQLIDPHTLWMQFHNSMCDDLVHKLQLLFLQNQLNTSTDDSAFYDGHPPLGYGLHLIDSKLIELSRSLDEFGLPTFKHDWINALNRGTSLEFSDQKYAFDTIVDKLQSTDLLNDTSLANSENAISFFLHGPAGTGKTFVYNTLSNYLRSQCKIVLCVTSSVNETSSCYIPKNSGLAELLRKTDLIIRNEVPMQNKRCFEAVDRTLKDIGSNNTLFGGLLVLLGGDFAQIPPVVRHGNRSAIVEASVEQSYIWPQSQVLYLKHNMRARGTSTNEIYFKKWLHLITYNKLIQNARVPPPQYIPQTYSLDELIYRVYPAQMLNEALNNSSSLCNSAILTSRNDTVDAINQKVLDMMPSEAVTLISADKADYSDDENANNKLYRVSNEYLQTLGP